MPSSKKTVPSPCPSLLIHNRGTSKACWGSIPKSIIFSRTWCKENKIKIKRADLTSLVTLVCLSLELHLLRLFSGLLLSNQCVQKAEEKAGKTREFAEPLAWFRNANKNQFILEAITILFLSLCQSFYSTLNKTVSSWLPHFYHAVYYAVRLVRHHSHESWLF